MPERWELVKTIVANALEVAPERRDELIERACGDDPELTAEVRALLDADAGAGEFLDSSPLRDTGQDWTGRVIGPFRVVRRIASGGMGSVYEATQEHPSRSVALKIIRPGLIQEDARRRFHDEIDALARLTHPAITRLYQAGIHRGEDGAEMPFFAMELVEGDPIDRHVEPTRHDVDRTLRLMLRVCEGVRHAHQRGVIHRDLKPDNILVGADGLPHILDFGIARLADPGRVTQHTSVGQLLGTVRYMSPEQLSGDPSLIDARSDVFALGVILYELLTGRPPLDLTGMTPAQAAAKVQQDDPTPLHRVNKTLRGDVSTIVETALATDPERRYQGVGELIGDIERYLNNEPISVRPASTLYQLGKFARRHRALTGAAAASVLLLVVGIVIVSIGLVEMRAQRDRAVRAESESGAINGFLRSVFESPDPAEHGREMTVLELLDLKAPEISKAFADQPRVRAALHSTIGWTYFNLGSYQQAEEQFSASIGLYTETDGPDAATTLEDRERLARVFVETGDYPRAREIIYDTLERARASLGPDSEEAVTALATAALLEHSAGDNDRAIEMFNEALERCDRAGIHDDDRMTILDGLAVALLLVGKTDEAVRTLEDVVERHREVHGMDHPQTLTAMMNLATVYTRIQDGESGERLSRRVLEHASNVWAEDHPKHITARANLASALITLGRFEEAAEISRVASEDCDRVLGPDNEQSFTILTGYGVALLYLGRLEEAEPVLSATVERAVRVLGEEHEKTMSALMNHAAALSELGRRDEAEAPTRRAADLSVRLLGEHSETTIIARNNLGMLLYDTGQYERAIEELSTALGWSESAFPDTVLTEAYIRASLGRALGRAGRHDESDQAVQASRLWAQNNLPEDHPRVEAIEQLALTEPALR